MMRTDSSSVYIVDDDASLRRSLRNLLRSVGFQVEMFESAEAFLEARPDKFKGFLRFTRLRRRFIVAWLSTAAVARRTAPGTDIFLSSR